MDETREQNPGENPLPRPFGFLADSAVFLPALTLLFGLQLIRLLTPGLAWTVSDRLGMSIPLVGLAALIIFSLPFLGLLTGGRPVKNTALLITAGGLGLVRLLVQFPWPDPLIDLALAAVGVVFFGFSLAQYAESARSQGVEKFTLGLLAGLMLDTVLHGAFGTFDIAWRSGIGPLLLVIALVFYQWLLLLRSDKGPSPAVKDDLSGGRVWPWLGIGPFLFLQMVVFQNLARFSAGTGWHTPQAFGWVLLAQVIGFIAAVFVFRLDSRRLRETTLTAALVLLLVALFPYRTATWQTALGMLLSHLSLSVLLAAMLRGLVRGAGAAGTNSLTAANASGLVIFVLLLFSYYAGYQFNLGFENVYLEPAAALILGVCAIFSVRPVGLPQTARISIRAAVPAAVLLLMPLIGILAWQAPRADEGTGFPVSVMTYNLHNGFNTAGNLDLEALAEVIEENNPDMVALQEVSRGWLISGRADMLEWLSHRLGLPYVSGPTAGPLWGNAVLSRYPVVLAADYTLPPRNLPLLRGFLSVRLGIGGGENLNIIATHLHHVDTDSAIRQLQVPVLIDFSGGAGNTVILGDLNAGPSSPEMQMLKDAGLVDAMPPSSDPGFTYSSTDLYERIDYIWLSPDLKVRSFAVPSSQASDHLPVRSVIGK